MAEYGGVWLLVRPVRIDVLETTKILYGHKKLQTLLNSEESGCKFKSPSRMIDNDKEHLGAATDAVFSKSEEMPSGSMIVRGYDFSNGLDHHELLKSYRQTGLQATSFALAVEEINKMDNHQVPSDVNVTEDSDKEDISKDHKQTFCETDTICSILPDTSSDTNIQKTPTWSTFNSLIGEPQPIWNVGIAAPLYRRSPTEWPVLLTILMQAQNINCITVGEGSRPIVTLNGDLYDRAVKIKDYKEKGCT
ncbi:Deoxyhypusine synthase [Nymphon striatum]|nr:Deoxyhypusine synthase [Nymphon striatum]